MGALPDNSDMEDIGQLQMAQYAQSRNGGGGALPAASTEDAGSDEAVSPQDMRSLQLLDNVRGQMAPKHTGATLLEGYGQAANNQYETALMGVKANALMKAKLAEIGMNRELQLKGIEEQSQARRDVANIEVGKNQMRDFTPDELKAHGYSPGDVVQVNRFGQQFPRERAPASQRVLTGYDQNGMAQYADPGTAITPKVRSDYQEYLRQANQASPHLDNMLSDLEDPGAQSALGVSGMAERGLRATVGQAANAMGYNDAVAPKDATLRQNMEQLNALLRPTLLADPRSQAAHLGSKDIDDMLPDPHSMGTSVDDARTKYKSIREHLKQRQDEYGQILSGKSTIAGNDSAPPAKAYTPEQAREELRRRAAARGAQ